MLHQLGVWELQGQYIERLGTDANRMSVRGSGSPMRKVHGLCTWDQIPKPPYHFSHSLLECYPADVEDIDHLFVNMLT